MRKIYNSACSNKKKFVAFLFACFFLFSTATLAQFRKLGFVYSENLKGGSVIFGNTLMQGRLFQREANIDLTFLQPGIYFIIFENDNGNSIQKFEVLRK